MIDAHCHLDFPELAADLDEVVARAHRAGVEAFVIPGVEPDQFARAAALQDRFDCVSGVGLHPEKIALHRLDAQKLAHAATTLGARFIGEFGFDRRIAVSLEAQASAARMHLEVARELELPVVLHVVRRHHAALEALRPFAPLRGMVHAFTGPKEVIEEYTSLGLHLSVGGAVTRPGARRAQEALPLIPAHRLLIETDSPDQAPAGYSGRNEPARLPLIARHVAMARSEDVELVASRSAEQTRHLFFER